MSNVCNKKGSVTYGMLTGISLNNYTSIKLLMNIHQLLNYSCLPKAEHILLWVNYERKIRFM